MSVPGLFKAASLDIVTDEGHHEIQLLIGDITKLPLSDQVDLLLISAFPGNYAPTPTSVVGALRRAFGLNVGKLAKNKAEDLRRNFNCWFSEPLEGLPYKRLCCFEQTMRSITHPGQLVGDVFRCMIPAFNNEPSSVISPVLASGDQNYDINVMLKSMIDAACHWIVAGLPLVCFKIVIFSREEIDSIAGINNPYLNKLLDTFEKLKVKWESQRAQWREPAIQHDVFLSYSEADKDYVEIIKKQLIQEKPEIRINAQKLQLNLQEAWQQEIYDAMIVCLRVITVLSPGYLESKGCIEEYNIALCCSHIVKRDILAPLYLHEVKMPMYMMITQFIDIRVLPILTPNYLSCCECVEEYNIALCCSRVMSRVLLAPLLLKEIPQLPVYMQQIQYLDCRVELGTEKLIDGCKTFVNSILTRGISHDSHRGKKAEYDVFLSYCHKNMEKADLFLDTLQKMKPDVKIFCDRNELKTGVSWQQILYDAIEGSSIVISLLSPEYMNSAVCTEEYNLALACHFSEVSGVNLVPVLIEDVDMIKQGFSYVAPVDGRNTTSVVDEVSSQIIDFLADEEPRFIFDQNKVSHHIEWLMDKSRNLYFRSNYKLSRGQLFRKHTTEGTLPFSIDSDNQDCDIFISVDPMYKIYGSCLKDILLCEFGNINIHCDPDIETGQLSKLEQAKLIIALISPSYFLSKKAQQEFQSALCRHRAETGKSVLFIIQAAKLMLEPVYQHLIPCNIACHDSRWKDIYYTCDRMDLFPFSDEIKDIWRKVNRKMPEQSLVALAASSGAIADVLKSPRTEERNCVLTNVVALDREDPNDEIPLTSKLLKVLPNVPPFTSTKSTEDQQENLDSMTEQEMLKLLPDVPSSNLSESSKDEQESLDSATETKPKEILDNVGVDCEIVGDEEATDNSHGVVTVVSEVHETKDTIVKVGSENVHLVETSEESDSSCSIKVSKHKNDVDQSAIVSDSTTPKPEPGNDRELAYSAPVIDVGSERVHVLDEPDVAEDSVPTAESAFDDNTASNPPISKRRDSDKNSRSCVML